MRRIAVIVLLLVAPPALGAWLAGYPAARYLTLAPPSDPGPPPGFSWLAFSLAVALLTGLLAALWRRIAQARERAGYAPASGRSARPPAQPFPWWGWLGLGLAAGAWGVAWTRMGWVGGWQVHTFTPLWLGYILTVNGLTWRRTGSCLLRRHPWRFLALFPLSAAFWWFFEYLNRFVQNWYYLGIGHLSPLEYLGFSTLAFSTVLPAVLSTTELLGSLSRLAGRFEDLWVVGPRPARLLAALGLPFTTLALLGLPLFPHWLYPLVWVAPGLVVTGVCVLAGRPGALTPLERGDWRGICLAALGALVCGFFWELWNSASLAHWKYAIPYLQRFPVFEMPVLGYAGYLPFGAQCLAVAGLLMSDPVRWVLPATPRAGPAAAVPMRDPHE